MSYIANVFIVGIVFYSIYAVFELFARKNERKAMIEKLSDGIDTNVLESNLKVFSRGEFTSWAIRIGCLLIGIGLGVLVSSIVKLSLLSTVHADNLRGFFNTFDTMYLASSAFFGGIGLVVAYFIERNYTDKKEREAKEKSEIEN